MAALPDVFRFRDYRAYLRALYAHKKAHEYGFSLRAFSKHAGLRSSNYLKLVMDGDRNLTPDAACKFAGACGLKGQAADYFCELVSFNQARSAEERERVYARLRRFRRYREVYRLDGAQDAYHSEWFIPAVRELAGHSDFREDTKWIAKTLMPSISPRDAQRALDVLLELGLLVRNGEGVLAQAEPLVQTPEGPLSHHVARFHRAMLERAAEALDRVPRDEREIASLTLLVEQARLPELKEKLERFREELLHTFDSAPGKARVVQINLQMFPLTGKED